ncbi:MAG: dihydroorotate dehydrogenase [Thermoanaerobaculum sp.]|nr:dihydroorotate dehydrogenase [Thermoanaerobaculum sp.]MDW7967275.1 dihydroorotate dehydrogenase [Thermoanaerobaculum sp.]
MVQLATQVGSLTLRNPVLAASGTFGYGLELVDFCPPEALGGVVTKGLSPRPRAGNPTPRIVETPAGMINSIGLQNIGVEAFCTQVLPALRQRGATVVVNVFGETEEEYATVVERLEREDGVAAYELNVSCPNVGKGGMEFGHDPSSLDLLVRMLRRLTRRPLWVKLSPNAPHLLAVAEAALAAGADALTLVNTFRALAIDAKKRRPAVATGFGGLSGPAIKPLALRLVWEVHRAFPQAPLVGIGGVLTGEDAVEFLLAGACAVQVGTATFRNPAACLEVVQQLQAFCQREGVEDVRELIGGLRWR